MRITRGYANTIIHKPDMFGNVKNGGMVLNEYGAIVKHQWEWLQTQYSYIELDKFVVMPNHFHGILGIGVGGGRDRPPPT